MKKGNMELGKKIITWAMAAVMTVTSVGGSFGTMTVYATDAPTAAEIIADSSDVAQAAADVADAAEVAADAAEATKEAADAAEAAADAAEALVEAVYGKENKATISINQDTIYVHTEEEKDPETGKTTEKVVADVEATIEKAEKAINANNTAVDAADTDVATITNAEKTTKEAAADAADAAADAADAAEIAKEALEAVLNAPADSPEGNLEAAKAAAEKAEAAYNDAVTAEGEAEKAAEKAAAEVEAAQKAYDDLAVQLDAIKTADAANKLDAAERELEEAQKAFDEAEKAYLAVKETVKAAEMTKAEAEDAVEDATDAVDEIKDTLADVKLDTDYETLVKNDDNAKKAVEEAEAAVKKVEDYNTPLIEEANRKLAEIKTTQADLEDKKADLEAQKAGLKTEKEKADSIVEAGDSYRLGTLGSNIDYYKYVAQRTPGWDGPFVYRDKEEIENAKKYVEAYNNAVAVSADYAELITDMERTITETETAITNNGTEITKKESEIAGYQGLIDAANKTLTDAKDIASAASIKLSAVTQYIYSGNATSYEMTTEEKNAYNKLVTDMNTSLGAYQQASGDTIKYIDATNETFLEAFVGIFTGETWTNINTELGLEGKYHDEKWYGTDGTCYVLRSDANNSKFLITMTNGKFVASKVDEMEAAAFKASFDAAVTSSAASAIAADIQREADAVAKYKAAREAFDKAKAKYDELNKDINATKASLKEAEEALNTAKAAEEVAKSEYEAAVVSRKMAQNYRDWTVALATDQVTRGDVQVDEDGNPVTTNTRFDLTNEGVKGQKEADFKPMTGKKATLSVPYAVYKEYVKVMYQRYAYDADIEGKYTVTENEEKKTVKLENRDGKGIAHESIESVAGVTYWEIVDGELTNVYLTEGIDVIPAGTYFVPYVFKYHKSDKYHMDGVFVTLNETSYPTPPVGDDEPTPPVEDDESTPPTGSGEGSTSDGGSTGGGSSSRSSRRSSSDEGAVLGAKREQEGLVPEDGQVLGAVRAPKTSDSSKAILWMLVMGGSALGAAAVLAQKKKEEA